ncbi:MAG: hypothetical protein HZT40_09130 [Candidatus Thiothrix singaporensis]|uniref:Uncharacterized protein n=1 Tax=Candidatus Thiothrix singaporensis TaxID=2799669 RepID=A0A7L6ARX4_9GAMM|nr:MAG: hypothetical protein HZT40_09130 [Candidatus Thiothrix singaporensis]
MLLDNQAYKRLKASFDDTEPAHLFLEALADRLEGSDAFGGFNDAQVRFDAPNGTECWFTVSGIHVAELTMPPRITSRLAMMLKTATTCCWSPLTSPPAKPRPSAPASSN